MRIVIKRFLAVTVFSACIFSGSQASIDHRVTSFIIVGSVVGYDTWQYKTTIDPKQWETLFVLVNKIIKGKETASYIKVNYTYYDPKDQLPARLFEGSHQWCFKLTRDTNCDGPIYGEDGQEQPNSEVGTRRHPIIKRVPGMENEKVPINVTLPCYVLRYGNFKPS